MMTVPVFNLGEYLREHGVSAYALAREVEGRVSASTVYGLARRPVQRIDLPVVFALLEALERLQGEPVSLTQMIDRGGKVQTTAPPRTLEELLAEMPRQDPSKFKKFRYDRSRKPVSIGSDGPSIADIISEGRGPR